MFAFVLDRDIENISSSKEIEREIIEKAVNEFFRKKQREEEIKKGEVI